MQEFVTCDAHSARGGPHQSRGLFLGWYGRDHKATLWVCTHRSKRGKVCGSVQVQVYPERGTYYCNEAQLMWNHQVMLPYLAERSA